MTQTTQTLRVLQMPQPSWTPQTWRTMQVPQTPRAPPALPRVLWRSLQTPTPPHWMQSPSSPQRRRQAAVSGCPGRALLTASQTPRLLASRRQTLQTLQTLLDYG
jgi:hypothetical protein